MFQRIRSSGSLSAEAVSNIKEYGRPLANTHKDNNEIPLRAREVLPGNRKDFSNYWNLLFYSHGSLSSGMRRCHRCDFTTFPIRRKPIYLGIEILLDQHNRGNCEAREEPHKSYLFLKCLEFSYDRCFNSNIISFTELDHTLNFLDLIHFSNIRVFQIRSIQFHNKNSICMW